MVASIAAVSSASAGAAYYGKDNYYAKGADAPEPSSWFGKGAASLGLKGGVETETFERVLNGETLDGRRVGQREGETTEQAQARAHRPGIDLTFSPPKDVSLLLYIGGDERILGAHRTAVDQTLKWAERNLAGTRIRTGPNATPAVKTGNLVVAKFEHDISRDKDPQLHTHAVIANMTKTEDGRWRALHNDPFFAHRKTLSLAYDAAMRNALRDLGYRVRLEDGKSGRYSVDGVPDGARAEFSKGKDRIDSAAVGLQHPTPSARDKLAVKTRPPKDELRQDERTALWETRGTPWKAALEHAVAASIDRQAQGHLQRPLDDRAVERGGMEGLARRMAQNLFRPTKTLRLSEDDPYKLERAASERDYTARAAVSFGLRHHEEREAAFSLHHVRRTALEHAADGVTLRDIDKELRLLRANRKLLVNAKDPNAESTTKRSLTHEERTLSLLQDAGRTGPLVPEQALRSALESTHLTGGQKAAIGLILGGRDRLVGVQGYAGTGKTTMMRQTAALARDLAPLAKTDGYKVLGLTPTHSARKTLEESGGFDSRTVSAFLRDASRGALPPDIKNTIVLIDEASFLSTRNMNALLERLIALKPARIVLSGDRRQHGAVEAGRPFDIAQRAGLPTAIMKDIVRLPKDEGHRDQRAAVEAAAQGNVAIAMKRLEANIVERPGDLAGGAVDAWRSLPKDKQDKALLVAPSHRLREAINQGIRSELIADGRLSAETTTISVLRSKNLTRAEAMSPRSYAAGDILQFHSRLDAINAKKNTRRLVTAVDEERGRLTLRNARGKDQTVPLSRLQGRYENTPYSLHREEPLELRRGDSVMFTRSNPDAVLSAMDAAKVVGWDQERVSLNVGRTQLHFDRNDPALRSLAHGYAMTSHAAQGRTANDVVAIMDSKERALTSQIGFYVSISRSADTLALVVDDKERVLNTLQRQTGLKASAMETEGRMENLTRLDVNERPEDKSSNNACEPDIHRTNHAAQDAMAPSLDRDLSL
jgi:conjugative relaxase-like TrwC/TraI family protein